MKSTKDYRQDFQYENGTLQFIAQPEGYIYKDATGYRYVYQYKDHLGNNRLSFMRNAGTTAIVKETNYYPFGLTHQGYNNLTSSLGSAGAKKYQYNGKELQEDYGLDWYDYGARFYDAGLGRWFVVDPLAEKHSGLSPYNYAANDPILFIDPNGKDIWIYYDGGKHKVRYEQGMKYKGNNGFVSKTVKYLNSMNSVKAGAKVLRTLIKSNNTFDFTYTKSRGGDRTLQFDYTSNQTKYKKGGGEIHAASLMNSKITSSQKVAATAHELFHGYERESGQNPGTVNGEVGAYLFGRGVSQMYEQSIYGGPVGGAGFGNSTKEGQAYNMAMLSLLYGWGDVKSNYNTAINNFRKGASVNNSGTYNGDKIDPAYIPLIYGFIPLVK
jgi:RHS repeat-associated protein